MLLIRNTQRAGSGRASRSHGSRRAARTSLTALLAIATLVPTAMPASAQTLAANAGRIATRIEALGRFGANPQGGVSRTAYSQADIDARDWLMGLMREAGLEPRIDTAGNILARRAGSDPNAPPILFGSHADSVPGGGNYDGQVGVITAIEAAQVLHESGTATQHPLEVVVFQNEEGGLIGSKAFAGILDPAVLDEPSSSGVTIREGIERIGGDVSRLAQAVAAPGDYAAYLEVHIEQGATLHEDDIDIGVVQGIVGIGWWDIIVEGTANHAGTTPMDRRRDALLAASHLVIAVNDVARSLPGTQVATVGTIAAFPGAGNVIPGRVEANLEIRDLSAETIEQVYSQITRRAEAIARAGGTSIRFRRSPIREEPAATDPRLRDAIEAAARELGYSTRRMPSGAGHDAQAVAHVTPVGMIFTPSVGGISHSPEEYTSTEDITRAANVLINTLLAVDRDVLD